MKMYGGVRNTSTILDLGIRWKRMVSFITPPKEKEPTVPVG
jgi:hypothetical protein